MLKNQRRLAAESQEKELSFRQQQIGQLEEAVRRMEANLRVAKGKLDNLTLCAPITGTLTSLEAEPGQSKSPGERLGQIDAPEGFKARAGIDEFYIDRVQKGRTGQFELSGAHYNMVVSRVYPEVREGKFSVDLEFPGRQAPGIRRGQTLHIRLELSDVSEALLLPRGGFFRRPAATGLSCSPRTAKRRSGRRSAWDGRIPTSSKCLPACAPASRWSPPAMTASATMNAWF
jgi:Multidrug resistance efflux pump